VEEKFKKIVAGVFHVDVGKVNENTRFIEDLHVKSIDQGNCLPYEFAIEVPISVAMKNKRGIPSSTSRANCRRRVDKSAIVTAR
jgi:hypothetical protein